MTPRGRSAAGLLAATLVATAVMAGTGGSAGATTGADGAVPPDVQKAATSVTLITGDRLTVVDGGGVVVQPGEGRDGVTFLTRQIGDRLQVIPDDALPLVDAGRLDPRLFEVDTLIAAGYDDRRGDLPLIVTGGGGPGIAGITALDGVRYERGLPSVDGAAVRLDKTDTSFWERLTGGAGALSVASTGTTVWLDGVRTPTLDVSVPQIGVPAAWDAGLTGAGVTVAVVDTGVDASHPDLAGRVVAAQDFTGTGPDDTEGHGTHVASTIAGSGAASDGRYRGVAPGVDLLDAKVCVGRSCPESFIIAGMEWAAAQGAKVVNMSLSGPDTPETDPLEQALENLTAAYGTLFVTAAGNRGADETVGSPASADAALAVGAVTKSDELATFSSRGPRVGDAAIKPDVTAPGQDIVAARSAASPDGGPDNPYRTLSGTSMATPHVTGAAALLAQQLPDASPATLKAILMASAVPHPDLGAFAQGAGRIDVAAAIGQQVTTSPPSLSFGRQAWPHDDDQPVVRTLTYHNSGTAPVDLTLTLDLRGPDGSPLPDGMVTLSRTGVSVPAGGDASVTVTVDTSVDGPVGYLTGYVVATGDGVTARTPLGVDREAEGHLVTAVHTDRAGRPAVEYSTFLLSLHDHQQYQLSGVDGVASVRVPPGRYLLISHLFTDEEGDRTLTQLAWPELVVDGARTVDLDARLGEPLEVSVERPDAARVLTEVTAVVTSDESEVRYGIVSFDESPMYAADLGPGTPVAGFTSFLNTHWARPDADGGAADSPYYYHLVWREQGRMFTGFQRAVRDRDLAEVRAEHAAQGEVRGAKGSFFHFSDVEGGWSPLLPFHLPFTRTEFYNTDDGVRWSDTFAQTGPGGPAETITETYGQPVTYRAGHRHTTTWNQAVFAPVVPTQENPRSGVLRSGDLLIVNLPTYGDAAGREGIDMSFQGRTALYRDGELVDEWPVAGQGLFALPPEPAQYRLEVTAAHGSRLELSTSVTAAWTFTSAHVDDGGGGKGGGKGGGVPQDLTAVRFMPALDDANAMRAGRGYVVPIRLDSQAGSAAAAVRDLSVEVSFDDGDTWRPVTTVLLPGGRALAVMPSAGPGYVSLRATARDTGGGTAEVTIIRAYRLAG